MSKRNDTWQAVKTLTEALKADPELWEAYKANIAMAFKDEAEHQQVLFGRKAIHEIANAAAERFLNLWCSQ